MHGVIGQGREVRFSLPSPGRRCRPGLVVSAPGHPVVIASRPASATVTQVPMQPRGSRTGVCAVTGAVAVPDVTTSSMSLDPTEGAGS